LAGLSLPAISKGEPVKPVASSLRLPFALTRNEKITSPLIIDGAHGEGGGQILRTALSLSAITSRALRCVNNRAKRRNPGLQPQHLSATRAAAAISGAELAGDFLGSSELVFAPTHPPQSGSYLFDVAEIAGHGSAGSTILILQTILIPLALAQGDSTVVVLGGTHQDWAPTYDDLANAYLPALRRMGLSADAELKRWGWYPAGGGEVVCWVIGDPASRQAAWPQPIEALERGPLIRISGRAVAANLPAHIAQRMADRARTGLNDLDVPLQIEPLCVRAVCPGAGIFLLADYETFVASFSAHGRQGKPSEAVADEAVAALRGHHVSGAAVELHLADQLLLPLAIAAGSSAFTMARPTAHLATNAWAIEQFGLAKITVEQGLPTRVQVLPWPLNAS
jgi:RNA 3'-terminal phosphate cyclase (ATP)